jgi:hypothetical protein
VEDSISGGRFLKWKKVFGKAGLSPTVLETRLRDLARERQVDLSHFITLLLLGSRGNYSNTSQRHITAKGKDCGSSLQLKYMKQSAVCSE